MDYLTRTDDIIAIYVDIHREYNKAKTDSIYKQLTSRIIECINKIVIIKHLSLKDFIFRMCSQCQP